ncbi:MATE family efflux transporter [Tropicimonas sp. S265A]|uniref:MATE family efflux transporter n=1 Tax=Tropicimonas sp. S265A TaxID=3415134 RepID=UPI003C79B359
MADAQARFLSGSLFRHVSVMSLTASIGLVAVFFVDFIDMVFIAMLGQAELAAAIGYAGAILFFTTSFGIGMAIAAGALVARALGAGETRLAGQRATSSLIFGVLFGAVFAALVWVNIPALVQVMGASGETAGFAETYLQIVVPSLPLLMVGMAGGAILRAHGAARVAMMATIWGSLVNAILDPILIFGLNLDLVGAALASVAARVTIGVVALRSLLNTQAALAPPTFPCLMRDLPPHVAIAFPAIMTQLATPVGQAYVTREMAAFGEQAVAGLAMISRLSPVAFGVVFALSGALGPIIGQNYGAGKSDRVREAFRAALIFSGLYVLCVSALLFVLRGTLADLFGATGTAQSLVFLFCGPLALAFYFNGVLFAANAAFNNLGRPFLSTATNWGRHTVGTIPLVMLGAALFGAPGVLIGQAAGGVVFGLLAAWLAVRVMADPGDTPRRPFAREGRLLSLVHLRR